MVEISKNVVDIITPARNMTFLFMYCCMYYVRHVKDVSKICG